MNVLNILHNFYSEKDIGAKVCEGVYIGSLETAMNQHGLSKYNIGAIVNLSGLIYRTNVPTLSIQMDDITITKQTIELYLEKFKLGCNYIANAHREGRNVLIHCAAGINRSATLIAFYLISTGSDYNTAYKMLFQANAKRRVALLTNESFKRLLQKYSAIKNSKN